MRNRIATFLAIALLLGYLVGSFAPLLELSPTKLGRAKLDIASLEQQNEMLTEAYDRIRIQYDRLLASVESVEQPGESVETIEGLRDEHANP